MFKSLQKNRIYKTVIFSVFLLTIMGILVFANQSKEDRTRKIWDTAFKSKRPVSKIPEKSKNPVYKLKAQPINGNKTIVKKTTQPGEDAVIGVTVLRFVPTSNNDGSEVNLEIMDHRNGQVSKWTPVRIETGTPLTEGEKVQLTIETPRTGYLYVIDQEQYADGSKGEPYLIFPTLRTHGGKNKMIPGRLIVIPGWDDTPPFFILKRSRTDHVGEILSILVTEQPLSSLEIQRQPIKLSKSQLLDWERKWKARIERIDMVGGVGKPYTKVEHEAGANTARILTQEEPMPQTIYKITTKPGIPLLIAVLLPIAKKNPKQ